MHGDNYTKRIEENIITAAEKGMLISRFSMKCPFDIIKIQKKVVIINYLNNYSYFCPQ